MILPASILYFASEKAIEKQYFKNFKKIGHVNNIELAAQERGKNTLFYSIFSLHLLWRNKNIL
jgi:hypothetical protein